MLQEQRGGSLDQIGKAKEGFLGKNELGLENWINLSRRFIQAISGGNSIPGRRNIVSKATAAWENMRDSGKCTWFIT